MYRGKKTKAKKLQFFISKVQISKIEFKSMNGIKKIKKKIHAFIYLKVIFLDLNRDL